MSPTNRQRLFKDWLGANARQLAEQNEYAYDYLLRRTDGRTIDYFAVGSLRDARGAKIPGSERHFSLGDSATPAIAAWTEWVVTGVGPQPYQLTDTPEAPQPRSLDMPALLSSRPSPLSGLRPQFAH